MPHATFDASDAFVSANLAVGVLQSGAPAPLTGDDLWDAPDGGLFASVADMTQLLRLFTRDVNADASADPLDGVLSAADAAEMMDPRYVFPDGANAYGLSFELHWSSEHSVWLRCKDGELAGYSTMMVVVPELQFAVVTAVLQSDIVDPTSSAFAFGVVDALLPAVESVRAQLSSRLWPRVACHCCIPCVLPAYRDPRVICSAMCSRCVLLPACASDVRAIWPHDMPPA
jgi:hypothetical protein